MRDRPMAQDRRSFLGRAAWGMAGALTLPLLGAAPASAAPVTNPSRVALTHGASRAENVFNALKLIEPQIRAGIAKKKRVVVKPNLVSPTVQLAATHAECLEAILEFLQPLTKEEIIVAETPASGPAAEAYDNFGMTRLAKKGRVRLADLDLEPFEIGHMIDERHQPRPTRLSKVLLDQDAYLISAAMLKAHDRAVATLGLKNMAVGAILKDTEFRWGKGSKGKTDKTLVHGGRKNEGIHYNLFHLAKRLSPDLTVLDGFQGMEGNGPVGGTPVDHHIAVASTDWLAADRTGVELMGFDIRKIGYLTFCAQAGMGEGDLAQIEVLGEKVADHIRTYRPHDNIEQQYKWLQAS